MEAGLTSDKSTVVVASVAGAAAAKLGSKCTTRASQTGGGSRRTGQTGVGTRLTDPTRILIGAVVA